ncbi:hypothetical protein L195_g012921, partial [Trifolium pratense]
GFNQQIKNKRSRTTLSIRINKNLKKLQRRGGRLKTTVFIVVLIKGGSDGAGFGFGPLEEAKCEMGFVVEVKCDLREIDGVDGGWVERMESVPARF